MPAYIKLCMQTWGFPYILLNYSNLGEYTDLPAEKLKRLTLPQIADAVRVHVLRDYGGYWLDCDTVMLGDLPDVNMFGYPAERKASIGYLKTEAGSHMFTEWSKYQRRIYLSAKPPETQKWFLMGNGFTDEYVKRHRDITIGDIRPCQPEIGMIRGTKSRFTKYQRFYFENNYKLSDIGKTDMLMLHNSWTPKWYKDLSEAEVLAHDCTLSNILRELTQ